MKASSELFWNASVDNLINGYVYDEVKDIYICLICGECFEKGTIYQSSDKMVDAEKGVKLHINEKHQSMFSYLMKMNKKYTGLSDIQNELLEYFYQGLTDKEISKLMGTSTSTIRNHRFRLKEKVKQAKIFLAIMNMVETKIDEKDKIVEIHKNAKMVDDRYAMTVSEKDNIINKFISEDNKLTKFPKKEKEKLAILMWIIKQFKNGVHYTEKEINEILIKIYDDHVLIRRYLIEYGFMNRKDDCSEYWVVF